MSLFGKTMTSARQGGKPPGAGRAAIVQVAIVRGKAVLVATVLSAALCASVPAPAATTERVVSDPQTGLAIDGFDPVAYFIDAVAKVGKPAFEFRYHGVIWRFDNPGNQAAFMIDPAGYEPHFGGHDPVAVGRGAPTPGNPEFWLIADEKLYLFYNAETRDAFRADPRRLAVEAEAKWPDVVKVLAR
jgi:hypothetical protein